MSAARSPCRLPLIMGLVSVFVIMGLCLAFVVGLLRAQERERAAPGSTTATVGHWSVVVSLRSAHTFDVTLRHLQVEPAAAPAVTLSMGGMSTPLAVQPLMNGTFGASGTLSMQGDWRLIVEDGDSTAEIPLPAPG